MILVRLAINRHARFELGDDIGTSSSSHQGWHPILVRHDLVNDLSFLNPARPSDHRWNAKTALPIRILLASERRNRGIRPGVVVRTVIGRVHDDGVIGNAQLIEMVE